eukprot:10408231-Ditylum_brightwellii.AAC.1
MAAMNFSLLSDFMASLCVRTFGFAFVLVEKGQIVGCCVCIAAPSDSPLGTPLKAPLGACLGGVVGLRTFGTSVPRCSERG